MTQHRHPDTEALDEAAELLRGVGAADRLTRSGAVEWWCWLACTRLQRAGAVTGVERPCHADVPARVRITEALARLSTLTDDCLDDPPIFGAIAAAQRALSGARTGL